MVSPDTGVKLLYIFGITNILFMVLTLFSCRCKGFGGTAEKILPKKFYISFYKKHCYYWWGFLISVFLHTVFAFVFMGSPF